MSVIIAGAVAGRVVDKFESAGTTPRVEIVNALSENVHVCEFVKVLF